MVFSSLYDQGFARIAACTSATTVADPLANTARIIDQLRQLSEQGTAVAAFPELCLSGYAIDDLLLQDPVLDATVASIETLRAASESLLPLIIVGAPLRHSNRLYNCAVVVHRGRVLGVVPKSYLPNYREFYERRHFASGAGIDTQITINGTAVPFGPALLFEADDVPGLTVHVEVCEDRWVPVPPSSLAALGGATVLVNISGSPITIGKARDRHMLCASASATDLAAYVYCAAGIGESSTDLSWDGQTMVYERGQLLAQTERFPSSPGYSLADVDLDLVRQDRLRQGTFDDNARQQASSFRRIGFTLAPPRTDLGLHREVARFPFVPADSAQLDQDCYEGYNIQVFGLGKRLAAIGDAKVVIGVSGGLDSTHALLVAAKAMDRAGRPRSDILAFTMPGFATSAHTKDNATALATALGTTFETLDIRPAAEQMLRDLGHPTDVYDVTYENVQAGLRTDYLFRIANQRGGIVLGTGDLSELALGWCTYGVGDQMSHYAVNCGVPKTLMQHLIRWVIASDQFDEPAGQILQSILDTEITPELVPVAEGHRPQSTQDTIGPYALHDFFLYYLLRHGLRPSKIAFLAQHAWSDPHSGPWPANFPAEERIAYRLPEIKKWLAVFYRRFMASQFKRTAIPNGPKVLAGGSLSPRGDWRSPSDATAKVWLDELAAVPEEG
ncbi:NAD+ synthase (glutamine-hydrolysing) [Propionibacterium cyclohexanicum]|uniref:Glutamine-dependent NAD(+) synthetase n=1 Tax=Propionibacterium cyclohexanicum TaxID=64702 RepID=A0A1H9RMP9_9ACTN|nr:NAD(+) synthase [Propionibacterium cyclohexanicum]SER73992.1 NAD+ synthase (glutamine-hydrolysing) [Propionibacterium cyclohexanicum]